MVMDNKIHNEISPSAEQADPLLVMTPKGAGRLRLLALMIAAAGLFVLALLKLT